MSPTTSNVACHRRPSTTTPPNPSSPPSRRPARPNHLTSLSLRPSPPAEQPSPPYLVHVGGCKRRQRSHSSPLRSQPQLRLGRQRGRPKGGLESPARLRPHSPPPPSLLSRSIPPPLPSPPPPHNIITRNPYLASTSFHLLTFQHQLSRRR